MDSEVTMKINEMNFLLSGLGLRAVVSTFERLWNHRKIKWHFNSVHVLPNTSHLPQK